MAGSSRILFSEFDGTTWIRVEGKGSLANSPALKRIGERAIESGVAHLVIDLEECPMMDSTFMGTITGLALRLAGDAGEGKVEVIHVSPRGQELMRGLGLDHLVEIDPEGKNWSQVTEQVRQALDSVEAEGGDKELHGRVSLEAHEALGKADASNIPRFKDVVTFLRDELDSKADESST